MPKLVLLRHGESLWNKENIFTGWIDIELSDFGREQAKEAGQTLKAAGFSFDIAFTSVLKRAVETSEIVLKEMGLVDVVIVESSWCLNERHYGALQGVNKKEAVEKFGSEQVMAWRRGYKQKPPAFASPKPARAKAGFAEATAGKPAGSEKEPPFSESLEDVFLRVVPYWQEKIAPAIRQGKNVLISAHGNSLRALVKKIDNISDRAIEGLNIPTGIPLVYELDNNLKPIKHYYLAKKEQLEEAVKAVKEETKI